jgi:signal transduction histidine kinase
VRAVTPALDGVLEPGDRIVLVNGVETGKIADLRRLLGANESSQLVVLRGEELASVEYRRPAVDVDLPWLALALLGMLYLAIGLNALWRTADGALFYGWCLASTVLYVFSPVFPVDQIGVWIYLGDELARLLLPPLTLHLFLTIPRASARLGRASLLLYLPAATLALFQVDFAAFGGRFLFGPPKASLLSVLDRLEMLHLAAFAAAAVVVLARRLRSVAEWEQQRQLLWLVVGTTAGYAPFLLLYGLPYLAGIRPAESVAALAVLPLAFVPFAFGWAILRYRLWDLGLIVRNGAAHVLTLIVGVGGFALLDLALRRSIPDDESLTRDLFTFFGGIAIAGLVVPAHRRINGLLERLQYGSSFSRRRGLGWFGQELLHERDLDRLCEALLTEIEQGLELERTNLLLIQGSRLVAVRPERSLPDSFAIETVPPTLWNGRFEVLSGVALPGEPAGIDRLLFAAGYRYVFPLTVRGTQIGLVLAGLRADDEPLDSDDVELVRSLLDQAALAIENAQLIDQVQRQLETVVALQRHSEGILESSPAGIAVLDRDDAVITANLAFAALVGRPRSEVIGRSLGSLLELGGLPPIGGGAVQVTCTDALGRRRDVEVSVAAMQPADSGDRRVLVLQDATERVAMEQALKEKDRLASLGVLAAGVAHEVNTPLTGISSYAQLLLAETEADDPRRALLEKVEKQTFRASRIVSNLLEFARKPGVERRPVELGALLGETADLLRERMATRGVRLVWQRPAAATRVVGSEGELQQVFTNLMINAIDAMTPAGGTLTVALELVESSARVTVSDEGTGIPAESRDSIFQPFFTTKRGNGGTGLGLSISHSIVEQHGGKIGFANLEPRGCRFTVELPLAAEPAAEPATGAP